MHFRYDDDFIEGAVFLAASGKRAGIPSLQIHRFHAQRERIYSVLDPDERNAAFFEFHLSWFREWGLESSILRCVNQFPSIPTAIDILAFRNARGKNDEGAELYVSPDTGRNAVIALRIERFVNDDSLGQFFRHELMHLSDMVDREFGYSPDLLLHGSNPSQQRIIRDRYRLLWDITIDGRLNQGGYSTQSSRRQHQSLFDTAYSFLPAEKRQEMFEKLWSGPPRHDDLLRLAADPRDIIHKHEPSPGGTCPLCGFPTFEWADLQVLNNGVAATLKHQFPTWNPEQGACRRCIEIYDSPSDLEWPATLRT